MVRQGNEMDVHQDIERIISFRKLVHVVYATEYDIKKPCVAKKKYEEQVAKLVYFVWRMLY